MSRVGAETDVLARPRVADTDGLLGSSVRCPSFCVTYTFPVQSSAVVSSDFVVQVDSYIYILCTVRFGVSYGCSCDSLTQGKGGPNI